MNEAAASVLVAAIAALASVAVAIITTRQHRATRQHLAENTAQTAEVLHQVKNDHPTNLRDDLDRIARDLYDKLERIESAQGYLGGTVGGLIRDVRQALTHQREHDVASAEIVERLHRRDDELAAEIRRHHSDE